MSYGGIQHEHVWRWNKKARAYQCYCTEFDRTSTRISKIIADNLEAKAEQAISAAEEGL